MSHTAANTVKRNNKGLCFPEAEKGGEQSEVKYEIADVYQM